MRSFWSIALLTFAIDQASKLYVLRVLDLPMRQVIEIYPPFLVLRMAWNRGINFGLFAGDGQTMRWGLIVIAIAISAVVFRWVRSDRGNPLTQLFGGLLIGGALGNVIDRIAYGAVADFLNMSCCGVVNPYVFNVADIAIAVGAIGLAIFGGTGPKTPDAARDRKDAMR